MTAPDIFYVEDNLDFTFIMEHAVKKVDKDLTITIIPNGIAALEMIILLKEAKSRPGMILLDLNLPGLSGLGLLKKIKEIPFFGSVPVVMFSSSDNPKDVKVAMEFGAADFVTKPIGYHNLLAFIRTLNKSWLNNNTNIN